MGPRVFLNAIAKVADIIKNDLGTPTASCQLKVFNLRRLQIKLNTKCG